MVSDIVEAKPDLRRFGYASGGYTCVCGRCGSDFTGDKRARTCIECALDMHYRDEITSLRKELAEARNKARDIAYVIDESGVTHRQFTVVYREDTTNQPVETKGGRGHE